MVYRYRALIPESKNFVREYEVKSDTTLYSFNKFIINDLGFSPDQMVLFRGYDVEGNLGGIYGLFDLGAGSMDQVTLEMVVEKGELELEYCFDLRTKRYIRLLFDGEAEEVQRVSYPRTTAEKGRNPDQFARKYEEFDNFQIINEEAEEVADFSGDEE